MAQLKKGPKILGLIFLAVVLFFGIKYLNDNGKFDSLKEDSSVKKTSSEKKNQLLPTTGAMKISTTAWVGHAAGPYANRGFKPNKASMFTKRGLKVEFLHNDDPIATKDNFVNGDCDMMWFTVDALPSILDKSSDLAKVNPVIVAVVDRSDGGDALVVGPAINNLNELAGKKVAYAERSPSHSLIIQALATAGLTMKDIISIPCSDPIQAAEMLRTGRADAACVWSPDDAALVKDVRGAKILYSSKKAPYAIMDILIAKRSWVTEHHDDLIIFLEEWFKAAGEIENNDTPEVRNAVLDILAAGYQGFERIFFEETYYNAQRSTYGDNLNFFGLNSNFNGVTGQELYSRMALAYKELGVVKDPVPWTSLLYLDALKEVNLSSTGLNAAEDAIQYSAPSEQARTAQAISTKTVSVEFPTGSATLDNNAKWIIDNAFMFEAKSTSMTIRVVGNTDNTGNNEANMRLSERRAQAVVDYLVQNGINKNRFIVRGDGPKKAIADGVYGDSPKHRVTNFELVSQ